MEMRTLNESNSVWGPVIKRIPNVTFSLLEDVYKSSKVDHWSSINSSVSESLLACLELNSVMRIVMEIVLMLVSGRSLGLG
ncbi:hypothetical protein HanIR_Chr15g0756021 [Helianthus annuus]|nr:hypothetical protein HanIR_Chr15g0756021 [Helianthus annuus]